MTRRTKSAALSAIVGLAFTACTTDPARDSALRSYDDAAALGLVQPRIERPYARIAEWPGDRRRVVEISR